MKRLTKKIDNGRFVTTDAEARSYGETDPEDGFFYNYFTGEAVDKLAAYEDTGLEPEEIVKAMMSFGVAPKTDTDDRIAEIINAQHEGRLIVLPCKVGETCKHAQGEIYINAIGEACLYCDIWDGQRNISLGECIGNCESAEAEKALEEVRG